MCCRMHAGRTSKSNLAEYNVKPECQGGQVRHSLGRLLVHPQMAPNRFSSLGIHGEVQPHEPMTELYLITIAAEFQSQPC